MKRKILIFTAIGLAFGLGQLFYTTTQTRQGPSFDMSTIQADEFCDQKVITCGYCPPEQLQGNICVSEPYNQKVRGWPITIDVYESYSVYDRDPTLLWNVLIFAGSGAVIGLGYALATSKNPVKKTKRK